MFVTEYYGQSRDLNGSLPAPRVPAIDHHFLTLTSSAQKVATISRGTNLVRLYSTVNAIFEIVPDSGSNATLTATAGEPLSAGQEAFRATPAEAGDLAVWARTA